ncbi:MAG TPA: iron-sulfur cluster assembly accessory protein [Polyangiaceae bacterium]|nr:iron-sulfur cluster assembly accessory protein [Polyangiaceae bacterium]
MDTSEVTSPTGSSTAGNAADPVPNGVAADQVTPKSGAVKREVHITPAAVNYAKKRLAARGTPHAAIRLGVRGGGCSGFNYVIEFSDDPPRSRDIVSELDGVRFYVDTKSLLYLAGSALDYENTLMFQGFRFKNPQEASRCGCGHSFTVK